ncbi:MAG: hypothetical protein LUO88_04710 [Methanoregulaceae archaeon]|nr:hypothetical protein [Methanoregulaceae archaeon]
MAYLIENHVPLFSCVRHTTIFHAGLAKKEFIGAKRMDITEKFQIYIMIFGMTAFWCIVDSL